MTTAQDSDRGRIHPAPGGWDYRVFERQVPDGEGDTEPEFFIGEAYYDDEHNVVGWTGPVEVIGEGNKASVRKELSSMLAALDRPTLDYDAEPPAWDGGQADG